VTSVPVCLSVCVCLSAIIYSKLQVRSSPHFFCIFPKAVARPFAGVEVIRYVLPVYG